MIATSILGRFFGSLFSHAISVSILDRFFEASNLKNRALASTGARFLQNRCFQKVFETCSILVSFSGGQNDDKWRKHDVEKHVFLERRIWNDFFRIFAILIDFGRPRGTQKSMKNRQNRVRDDFEARLGFWIDLGNDFGMIWNDFGWILGRFWNFLAGFFKDFLNF